jgi:hypothetical protein
MTALLIRLPPGLLAPLLVQALMALATPMAG